MTSFSDYNNNKKRFVRQPGFHPNDPPDEVVRGASEVGEGGSQGGSMENRGGEGRMRGQMEDGLEISGGYQFWRPWVDNER